MAKYRLSNTAVDDLIRIYQYGLTIFGEKQADEYYNSFFDQFDAIASRPYSFEAVDYIKSGYRRCPCGVDTIYFRVADDEVEIMTIMGMQDLKFVVSIPNFGSHKMQKFLTAKIGLFDNQRS
ncbi:MAG: type II toxin-antitoxin system RelE/ParE family toxin [Saprospiraceae bacterium]|nr:type II toxin-antitoxin system RelE/ParE family toxin [Saprospiraceae bacterium]